MSNRHASMLDEFAQRLLACEASLDKSGETTHSTAFRVCKKLRETLVQLMGIAGFRSLESRAVELAREEIPWLGELRVNEDGFLEGLTELEVKHDSQSVAQGELVLVSQLLGLLMTFIGPALTLRFLQDIWPKMNDLKLQE